MENIWSSVLEFFAKASADLALKIVVAGLMIHWPQTDRFSLRLLDKAMNRGKLDDGLKGF